MVPAFPPGTRLSTQEGSSTFELLVSDRRCPPGFDDCVHCNLRWAEWLVPDGQEPPPGRRIVHVISEGARVAGPPELPTLSIFKQTGRGPNPALVGFYEEFPPWPMTASPLSKYALVDLLGIHGTVQHVETDAWCGFMYSCWYGAATSSRRTPGPVFAIGPFSRPPVSARVVVSERDVVEVTVDKTTRLKSTPFSCLKVRRRVGEGDRCIRSRLEHPDGTIERVIGFDGSHHRHTVELCRRQLTSATTAEFGSARSPPRSRP